MTAESENQMKSRMTESDAILRAREGDSLGFEYLYDSHRKRVYSVCLRMVKNSADAEDLTQQAFLQVFRKLSTFRGESGFSTWLHRVTINVVLRHLRRKKPTEARTEDLDGVATNTEVSHELAADDASLLGAIDRLTLRRAAQAAVGLSKILFAPRRHWIQTPRNWEDFAMLDRVFQIAVAQGPQADAGFATRVNRGGPARHCLCVKSRIGHWTEALSFLRTFEVREMWWEHCLGLRPRPARGGTLRMRNLPSTRRFGLHKLSPG